MFAAFAWGFAAAATLIAGGAFALRRGVGAQTLGMIMAFGSGVLISAVSFELVAEAFDRAHWQGSVALGLCVGSIAFFVGDSLVDRMGGADRKGLAREAGRGHRARDRAPDRVGRDPGVARLSG